MIRKNGTKTKEKNLNVCGFKMTCMVSLVDLRVNVPWWIKRDRLVGNRQKKILVDRRIWVTKKEKKSLFLGGFKMLLFSWWIKE